MGKFRRILNDNVFGGGDTGKVGGGDDDESEGFQQMTSDVDNPQQNRRVEKKHRHILDTARALKFHAKLLLKFWGDRVTTATYLINRMPSSVIGNVTPSEIPLQQKLIYDHLIVFGCLAIKMDIQKESQKRPNQARDGKPKSVKVKSQPNEENTT
ncbi:retrovirus-related pol polyprotein from transposon TNT 1-94 [Tanacetum coccineum]|uniref:Retrovirus-related pol polyprotein from transposon TNT 1-94 n=1 Tax=Tanacetum coccineum TaxID=301880 RepID=A0ABQ5FVI0_9ASTR